MMNFIYTENFKTKRLQKHKMKHFKIKWYNKDKMEKDTTRQNWDNKANFFRKLWEKMS